MRPMRVGKFRIMGSISVSRLFVPLPVGRLPGVGKSHEAS